MREPDPGAGLELRQLNRSRGGVAVKKVSGGERAAGARAGLAMPGGGGALGESGLRRAADPPCGIREGACFLVRRIL